MSCGKNFFFFFQAEDGIRDVAVTGVQTCALPIFTGGPNAGTYDGTTDRGGCSAGFTGKSSWGNQYSLVKENNPKVLNSLQLIVPDGKAAAAGTHDFFLNVAFARITARVAEYKVE